MTLSLRWACKIMSWFYIPYQRPKFPSKVCSIKGFVVFFAVLPFAYKLLGSGPCPIWMSISAVMNPIEGPFLAVRGSIHFIHLLQYFRLHEYLQLFKSFTFWTILYWHFKVKAGVILKINSTSNTVFSVIFFVKKTTKERISVQGRLIFGIILDKPPQAGE